MNIYIKPNNNVNNVSPLWLLIVFEAACINTIPAIIHIKMRK